MSKKNVSAIVSGMGAATSIIEKLVAKARNRGITDETIHSLATPVGEKLIDRFVDVLVSAIKGISDGILESGKTHTYRILRPVAPTPAASHSFKANDTFFKKESGVKLVERGSNFRSWFAGKVEEDAPVRCGPGFLSQFLNPGNLACPPKPRRRQGVS